MIRAECVPPLQAVKKGPSTLLRFNKTRHDCRLLFAPGTRFDRYACEGKSVKLTGISLQGSLIPAGSLNRQSTVRWKDFQIAPAINRDV
jgi:hypothetical protein